MDEFHTIDWNAPIDVEALTRLVPANARVKGVFFHTAVKEAQEKTGRAPGRPSYGALTDYPSEELVRVLAECARLLHPDLTLKLALRTLGRRVFENLKETTAGTFLFSVAGRNVRSAFKLVNRAYKLFSTNGTGSFVEGTDGSVTIELRNIWTFPDAYHIGIFEGAMAAYGAKADLTVRRRSACDVDLRVVFS